NCTVSDSNRPVLFPIGASGSGGGNIVATNSAEARAAYAAALIQRGHLNDVVERLILDGDTGIEATIDPDHDFTAGIKFVSAITLAEMLGPFERVDLLDSDIQQAESIVFPPAMECIVAKVRRVHIGTHGSEVHAALLHEFVDRDFEIVFNLLPTTEYRTAWGDFTTQVGVITALNPRLAPEYTNARRGAPSARAFDEG